MRLSERNKKHLSEGRSVSRPFFVFCWNPRRASNSSQYVPIRERQTFRQRFASVFHRIDTKASAQKLAYSRLCQDCLSLLEWDTLWHAS